MAARNRYPTPPVGGAFRETYLSLPHTQTEITQLCNTYTLWEECLEIIAMCNTDQRDMGARVEAFWYAHKHS